MEMRAREDTPMSHDITPRIPPIAASLHDKFLPSHCSSCFRPLPSPPSSTFQPASINIPLSCTACSASVQYCSPDCAAADSFFHAATGECRLFVLRPFSPAGDTTDVRVALRLLHSFERHGLLSSSPPCYDSPRRIGGLLASGLDDVMDEGGQLAETIEEGAALMARARNPRLDGGCCLEKVSIEKEVLWAVMMNAVEVEIGELGGIGVAVYGPSFSWFNHSCLPTACYRFELSSGFDGRELRPSKVYPARGAGETVDVSKLWNYIESSLADGFCWFGPRIIVRNIKPLKENDEVCIAYTDLLQPKELRHFDLWSRYRFVCYCERCCRSPQMLIDYILSGNAQILNSGNPCYNCSEWLEVSVYLEETLAEYMLDGNPEVCCRKLGKMLFNSFHCKSSELRFRLHPIHFVSLKAYIALSSAYTIQATNFDYTDLSINEVSFSFEMARAAAAFSLLIAGATHHLFMSETSIISNTALFWIGAGESILYLVRIARSLGQCLKSGFSLAFVGSLFTMLEKQVKSQEDLLVASARFIDTVSHIIVNLWPFLAQGHSYLECIENPVNFNCLQKNCNQNHTHNSSTTGYGKQKFSGRKYGEMEYTVEWNDLHQLAVFSLMYGRYLTFFCHGPESHLSVKVGGLLECILKETVL